MRSQNSRMRRGRVAAPAQTRDGRHPRVVPAVHMTLGHQLGEPALAHHRVFEVEPAELVLTRDAGHRDVRHAPVVEGPMVLELQGADGVGDALQGVGDGVGVVVGGIQAPLAAGLMMDHPVADAIEHRIAQVDVGRGHIDPRPQRACAVGKLARAHAPEEIQVLLDRAVAPRAVATRLGQGAAVGAGVLGAEVADVGQALLDQLDRESVELLEIVRGEIEPVIPVVPQPVDVGLDGLDELDVLLVGIGVVETQVAGARRSRAPARN